MNKKIGYVVLVLIALVAVADMFIIFGGEAETTGMVVQSQPKLSLDPALIVNGEEVSIDDVRKAYVTYAGAEVPNLLSATVQSIVDYRLLLQEAERLGISVTDSEIEQFVSNVSNDNGMTVEQFDQFIEQSGKSTVEYRNRVSGDLKVNKLMTEMLSQQQVTDEELSTFYNENPETFSVPKYVRVRQIFLAEQDPVKLQDLVNLVIQDLGNRDFCEVAEQYGSDKDTCMVYTLERGVVDKNYEDAAFSQNIGDVSVVRTTKGVNLVQTLEKLEYSVVPYDQVQTNIHQYLLDSKYQDTYNTLIQELRSKAVIVNNLE